MPLISVVVPVYNSERYLNRCVDSILNQTFHDFELILVDDGSKDQSGEMCDGFRDMSLKEATMPLIRVIHQENAGQAAARNKGIEKAYGKWICFIDSDDYVHPQMLDVLFRAIQEKHAGMSMCGAIFNASVEMPEWEMISEYRIEVSKVDESFFLSMKGNEWNNSGFKNEVIWGRLIPKDIILRIPFSKGHVYEDTAVMCRWFDASGTVADCKVDLYYYTDNPDGTMNSVSSKKRLDRLWMRRETEQFYYSKGYDRMREIILGAYLNESRKIESILANQEKDDSLATQVKKDRVRYFLQTLLSRRISYKRKVMELINFFRREKHGYYS